MLVKNSYCLPYSVFLPGVYERLIVESKCDNLRNITQTRFASARLHRDRFGTYRVGDERKSSRRPSKCWQFSERTSISLVKCSTFELDRRKIELVRAPRDIVGCMLGLLITTHILYNCIA